jgi:hypothetical protein
VRCRGFEPGNVVALRHGAFSEAQIRPVARNHRRKILRQIGLSPRDLDPVGRALLEHYTRLTAKIVAIDRYVDEVGVLDVDGTPRPCMTLYVQLHRAGLGALGRLEHHLDRRIAPDLDSALAALREGL